MDLDSYTTLDMVAVVVIRIGDRADKRGGGEGLVGSDSELLFYAIKARVHNLLQQRRQLSRQRFASGHGRRSLCSRHDYFESMPEI